ncbi:PREDICTED: translation initiation factor eIF-2B subunit gamma-like [Priapulus caudatus]|uniref:Translation initiation factor eIF2B subunit gamma n=1 Tax=Priapulus caudatus TaxID=37621 RepID=A0ABM1END8_PRICU|nr:PREDICTED: translation initiation factor eIF-2B subunit gamma-like [Priapulus caudatus]
MEFQAVVMAAGKGSRMVDLTAKTCKALLPIGNIPMVWYPLNQLERAGFEEAIVVVLQSAKKDVYLALSQCDLKIKLDFVSINDDQDLGTADSLRLIADKIERDVIVISCDLICDVQLHLLADVHRSHDATITALLAPLPKGFAEAVGPGPKSKRRSEKDLIGLHGEDSRIVMMGSEADFEENISLRRSILKRFPNITIYSSLTDGHLYIMKKSVVEFLASKPKIGTLKGELLPYFVKKQFSTKKTTDVSPTDGSVVEVPIPDIFSHQEENKLERLGKEMSSSSRVGDIVATGSGIRCYAYITQDAFCVRTNTMAAYCEMNRQVTKFLKSVVSEKQFVSSSANVNSKAQVGHDSMVGEGATVGERASVKRSIVGHHCDIGEKVKIANSLIMNHATVKEGCNLHNCIIGPSAHIAERAELKDCLVGASQNVSAMAKLAYEVVVDADKLMEI